jgi:hypothetical protein
MLQFQIRKWFFEEVRMNKEAPQDLKDTLLKGHPKIDGFINRLTDQLIKAEEVCRRKGVKLKNKTIQDTVYDLTKYFMKGLEGEAKRRYESDVQKTLRQAEAQKQKEFDAVLAGKPEGEFAEAGVISNEEIDKQREDALEAQDRFKQAQAKKQN